MEIKIKLYFDTNQNQDFINAEGSVSTFDIREKYLNRLLNDCEMALSDSGLLNEIENFEGQKKLKIVFFNA